VYCDSEYAFTGGEQMSLESLVQACLDRGTQRVCVTGGEPLAQPDCIQLLSRLCDAGFSVSLETSGAMDVQAVDPRVSIVMDLKTPGSGEVSKNRFENLLHLAAKDQIKVVITDTQDLQWIDLTMDRYPKLSTVGEIWLSPAFETMDIALVAQHVIEAKYPYRLQMQLHKAIWGEEAGR
jgi:7-carboxy-7-deazaguanine synthase